MFFLPPEVIAFLLGMIPSIAGKFFSQEKVMTHQVNVTQNNNSNQGKAIQQDSNFSSKELFTYAKYAAGITTAAFYIKTFYSIKKAQNLILSHQLLSSWKANTSLDAIIAMDSKQLLADFNQEAKAKCAHEIDFMYDPIVFIAKKIQEEYQLLKHYLELYSMLETLHITMLFPLDKNCRQEAKECLHKLALIKKLI